MVPKAKPKDPDMYISQTALQNMFSSATLEGTLERGVFHWHADGSSRREDRAFIENGVCVRYGTRIRNNGVWGEWDDSRTSGGPLEVITKSLECLKEWGWTVQDIWTRPCAWPRHS